MGVFLFGEEVLLPPNDDPPWKRLRKMKKKVKITSSWHFFIWGAGSNLDFNLKCDCFYKICSGAAIYIEVFFRKFLIIYVKCSVLENSRKQSFLMN